MRRFISLVFCLLISGGALLTAQTPSAKFPGKDDASSTFETSTRVVLLDVLVTDKAGKPVRGLKAGDFTVLEDGKPQPVRNFEEHGPDMNAPNRAVAPDLPPNTYTNYVTTPEPGAINILLFDTLNTHRQGLVLARQELLQYLSKLPSDSRFALFTLDWQLHLVQGFTDDAGELIAAAQQLSSSPHPMYNNARGVSAAIGEAREALLKSPRMYQKMVETLWSEQEGKEESRMSVTMEALNQLARSVAIFPGRKNLIWISGGVPFDATSTDPQMQKTATLLAATQVSVYPIDVGGVRYLGADGSTRSSEMFGRYGGSYDETSGQYQELLDTHQTMTSLATLTGGTAYLNRNDLAGEISDSIDSGSHYYTLLYRPRNDNWNGRFRRIAVKASPPNVKIHCRAGYYAVPDPLASPNIDRTFSLAMQPTSPVSTTLIMKALVVPPEEPEQPTRIDLLVDVHALSLTQLADHRSVPDVMFAAEVWDAAGKPGGSVSTRYRRAVSPGQLESLMRTGLRSHQEMQLRPGTYQLRLGVVDRLSGKIGTLDVPLTIGSKAANTGSLDKSPLHP